MKGQQFVKIDNYHSTLGKDDIGSCNYRIDAIESSGGYNANVLIAGFTNSKSFYYG